MSELQQGFPGDPQISALYREHAREEPPAAVDERILAAARAAVSAAAPAARRTWWQRWRATLALATTLVLTLSLSLLHERQPDDRRREAEVAAPPQPVAPGVSPAAVARDVAVPAAAPAAAPAVTAEPAVGSNAAAAADASAPGAAPRQPASGERLGGQRAPPPVGESGLRPSAGDSSHPGGSVAAKREEATAAALPPVAKESPAVPLATTAAPAVAGVAPEAAAPGQVPAARQQAPAGEKARAADLRRADDWLEEIRALRRAGRSAEAARQLADFRRAHPDYPLPEEFRQ